MLFTEIAPKNEILTTYRPNESDKKSVEDVFWELGSK